MIEDNNKISKIKKDYMSGKTYKQIAEKHGVTYNEVLYLVKKKQWKRDSNLSKVKKGNQNAKGNKCDLKGFREVVKFFIPCSKGSGNSNSMNRMVILELGINWRREIPVLCTLILPFLSNILSNISNMSTFFQDFVTLVISCS